MKNHLHSLVALLSETRLFRWIRQVTEDIKVFLSFILRQMPYYVVRQGRKPGIYNTWEECQEQINHFSGAQYKKFKTHSDAQEYLGDKVKIHKTVQTKSTKPKPKRFDNVPVNLIKQEISDPPKETLFSSYEKLTVQNPNTDTDPSAIKGGLHVVYSDGCCFGNGQVGSRAGYGVYWDDGHPWNVSERLRGDQTNQRAELTAAISAMEIGVSNGLALLEIRTDSKYTIKSATEWIPGWKRNNWIKKTDSKPVMNQDLMMKIDDLQKRIKLKWTYVPGHSSIKGNDEADRLAKAGAQKP